MPAGLFILIAIFITMILCCINGGASSCLYREYSPLCFCQSTYKNSQLTDMFISKLVLSQCTTSYSIRQCRQGRFSPSSTHVTQLVPNLVNHSHCLDDMYCLQALRNSQRCQRCQLTPSSLLTENSSYTISTTTTNLPTDSCFYICEHDKSCGFLCLDRRITITINCNTCDGRRRNVTCRCMKVKQPERCPFPAKRTMTSTVEATTSRWMQKRGFPAAGILALIVLVGFLLIIAGKLVNRRLDGTTRRKSGSIRRSVATITTYRSRQPSPSTAISFPNTPLLHPAQLKRNTIPANTIVGLIHDKSQEFVVDIHRRDDEDELSVFLLEKPTQLDPKSKQILDEDDDDDDEQENRA